jgi:O-antigen/teichoic acid export membrane protein
VVKKIIRRTGQTIRKKFDGESKTLIKNSSWVFIASFIGAGFAFLRSIIIARGLGADILGYYTIAIAFVTSIQEILKLNVATGLIRYGAQYLADERRDRLIALLKFCIVLSMGSALVSIIIVSGVTAIAYDNFLSHPGMEWFIIAYAIVNGFAFLDNIGKGVLKLFYRFKTNSIISIIMDSIEFTVISLVIYFFPKNLSYFFTAVIATRMVNSLVCNFSVLVELKKELSGFFLYKMNLLQSEMKDIMRFTFGHSFNNTLKTLMNQGDVLLLNYFAGATQVGFYAVAKKLAYSILTITDPLVTSIYPQLSLLTAQKKYQEIGKMLRKTSLFACIPLTAFLIVAFFLKSEIIVNLYGKQFEPAVNPFYIHLVDAAMCSVFFWILPLAQSLGMIGLRFRIYIGAIITGTIVSLLLVEQYEASGIAWGLFAANFFITAAFIYFARKSIVQLKKTVSGDPIPAR